MFATCLTLLAISVQTGHVVTVPHATPLLHVGRDNWILQDQSFEVTRGTHAIVMRVAPDGVEGVVEVKIFDGTNRLGWVEAALLTVLGPPGNRQANLQPTESTRSVPSRRRPTNTSAIHKRRQLQNQRLARIDAMLGGMMQAALLADAVAYKGPLLIQPEVFQVPIVNISQLIVPIF